MKINIEINHSDFRILINGLPSVYILRKEFIGFQAWIVDDAMFVIEYYTKTNKIKTEFDSKHKWISILKQLNKLL